MSEPSAAFHRRALLGVALCAFGALVPARATANALAVHGAGARGTASAGAGTAGLGDVSAVYYNPAAMVLSVDTQLAMGLLASQNLLEVRLAERPAGYDPQDLGSASPTIPYERLLRERSETDDVPGVRGIYLGAISDLGFEHLRLGLSVFLPLSGLGAQRTHFADEREQLFSNQLHFELVGERLQSQVVLLAAAYELLPWLSVGVGCAWMPTTSTNTYTYLDNPADQSDVEMNLDVTMESHYSLSGGVLVRASERLRFGVAGRDESYLLIEGISEVQVRGFDDEPDRFPFFQKIESLLQYSPRQIDLGFAYAGERWTLYGSLQHLLWSRYRGQHGETAPFRDTWSPRVALERSYPGGTDLWLGLSFVPTPVPAQTGRTNYVDNDRYTVGFGVAHPFELRGRTVEVSLYGQVVYFPWQEVRKEQLDEHPDCGPGVTELCDEVPDSTRDPRTGEVIPAAAGLQTGNPGFPAWSSGGWAVAGGTELRWSF